MTAHKHLKQLVRSRMQKTGESYATARRQTMRQAPATERTGPARWHLPGNIPATTALRIALTAAGVVSPHNGLPFSEAMLFGIAGGVGFGAFSFLYEKEDCASFFVAGRHNWQDDDVYLRDACTRLGLKTKKSESSGAKAAEQQLRAALADGQPMIAWVDMTLLPHRGISAAMSGSGYHVVTLYSLDDSRKTALLGDLTDDPIEISQADLATTRARIKKQKNRLLSVVPGTSKIDLRTLIYQGLRACHKGLTSHRMQNFRLDAIETWGQRLHRFKDNERWERIFPRGKRLFSGLTAIYKYIEHYGTGGGLCRPIFADFLEEAASAIGDPKLQSLAERYAELGRAWTELANAALPDDVPLLREAKELQASKSELMAGQAPADDIRGLWKQLDELGKKVGEQFPLTETECADLRARLQKQVLLLYVQEVAAHAAMGELVS